MFRLQTIQSPLLILSCQDIDSFLRSYEELTQLLSPENETEKMPADVRNET